MGPSQTTVSPSHPPAGQDAPRAAVRPGWVLLALVMALVSTLGAWLQSPYPVPATTDRSWLDWWRYPIERHAGLRLPAMPSDLHSLHFSEDGERGWAVGAGGAIMATRDAGRTWVAQVSGTGRTFNQVRSSPNGDCWAVGRQGVIAHKAANGQTWALQVPNRDIGGIGGIGTLNAVFVHRDGNTVWAAGDAGTLLKSVDAGRGWTRVAVLQAGHIHAIHFAQDARRGWFASTAGLSFTEDGGDTWGYGVTSRGVMSGAFHGLAMAADGATGWAVGERGTIAYTVDGGRTWRAQTSGVNTTLRNVRTSADGRLAVAVGDNGVVLWSQDGGNTWRTGGRLPREDFQEIALHADGQRAWLVGTGGLLLHSRDAGASWTQHYGGGGRTVRALWWQVDSSRVWAAGDEGLLLHSADGGANWSSQDSGTKLRLLGLRFGADGLHGVAVGQRGTLISTDNRGLSWRAHDSGTQETLTSVDMAADGGWARVYGMAGQVLTRTDFYGAWSAGKSTETPAQMVAIERPANDTQAIPRVERVPQQTIPDAAAAASEADLHAVLYSADRQLGWIAGEAGTVLFSRDRGITWAPADTQVGVSLLTLAMDERGQNGWVGGFPPGLLRTADAGRSWTPIPAWPLRYQRYPAPWYYLGLLLAAVPLWLAFRPKHETVAQGAEAMGATDAPTESFAQDRLQFGPLARGISRFLRNARTEPPLTIAVSGEWGSGKSSLMALVCADLRRYGSRPVWFNAWHHQNEEQLLASLLSTIRDRGLPHVWTIDGLAFRLRLLWLRSRKHFVWGLVVLVALSVVSGYLWNHNTAEWAQLWGTVTKWLPVLSKVGEGSPAELSAGDAGKLLSQVLAGVTTVVALSRALKAFGADPAVLLASAAANFTMKDASAQTSFRSRFAEQFAEVTQALPYRMVIVIDDLDRCRPETVLDVMEAVNFLVSSGRCIVMFGMATQRVNAALGLAFEKIAKELDELDVTLPEGASAEVKEKAERARRHAYARNYLEKLINLEVTVPQRADLDAYGLLERATDDPATGLRSLSLQTLSLWPLWLAGCAVALGVAGGMHLRFGDDAPSPVAARAPAAELSVELTKQAAASVAPSEARAPVASAAAPRYLPAVQPGQPRTAVWLPLLMGLLVFVATAAGLMFYRVRTGMRQVQDSPAFDAALRVWLPVVQQRRGTPRAIKRFGNRLRYLAMLQQGEALDRSLLDELGALWRNHGRRARDLTPPVAPHGDVLPEHTLVALGALHEAYGAQWREQALALTPSLEEAALAESVGAAKNAYQPLAGHAWPPEAGELDAFERMLKGVRLAGDRPGRAAEAA